jgi:major membrane immunogen (membrane-anchored lipoprotein)
MQRVASIKYSVVVLVVGICAAALLGACSDNDNGSPVTPNGNGYDYDTTMMALIPAGTFRMGQDQG